MSPHGIHTRKSSQFRLPPDLLAKLKTIADQRGETMTDIVTRAVTAELDRLDQEKRDPDDCQ